MSLEQFLPTLVAEFQSLIIPQSIQFAITLAPIALCIILAMIMWPIWVRYVRAKFLLSLKHTLLEVALPKDTFKSPLAMEVFLQSLHNTANGSHFAQFWKGEMRPWYTLEIISIEGRIKFFIWTEDRRKAGVINGLYSQFPGIEVKEAEDYTKSVHFDPNTMKVWAGEMKFLKNDAYPIKTYVDYGLDKDPKEEFKIDPMLPMLEFLGSVGPNQQVWIQILIQAHIPNERKAGHWFKKVDSYQEGAKKLVNEIMIRDSKTKGIKAENKKSGEMFPDIPRLSKGEQEVIDAVERSVSKLSFDTGIRGLYIGQKESFNVIFGVGGILGSFKHFNTEHLNGFKPNGDVWHPRLGDPWKDYKDRRRNRFSADAIAMYKRRSYFYAPHEGSPLVLSTEELATIYHFPGSVAATPTLQRIPSKKAEAPSNLPL